MFYNQMVVYLPIWQQKGGFYLDILSSFFVTVMASVTNYYICKWLDSNDN